MHRSPSVISSESELPLIAAAGPSIDRRSATHRSVARAFEAAINEALEQAARVELDPGDALHQFRRAVRRARAVIEAVAHQLPPASRLELLSVLRAVIRATGAMRDRDALPVMLAELPHSEVTAEARATLEARLLGARLAQRQPLQRARRLAVAAAKLTLLPQALEAALCPRLPSTAIHDGWLVLARRARKATRAALLASENSAIVHRARKRLRLLAQSLLALSPRGSSAARRGRRFAELSTRLGATLDYGLLVELARADGAAVRSRSGHELVGQLERHAFGRRPKLLKRARRSLARRRWKLAELRASHASQRKPARVTER